MVDKEKTILNLANGLSILRMLLGPVFMISVFREAYEVAFTVLLVATLTDFLDGQIARIWKMQTRLGKMLDPLADKIVIFFAIITLLIKFDFPIWVGILIIARDIIILAIGSVYIYKNKKKFLRPNLLGKITTFFQMFAIVLFVINIKGIFDIIKNVVLILAILSTLASGIVYLIKSYNLFFTKKSKIKINLPNKITILRIILIPLFILFLLSEFPYKDSVAASMFILLALSDALDGYLARKRRQITSFGKLIDPLADKLLVSAALVFLIGKGVDAWMAYIIIAREFVITGLRMVAAGRNYILPARLSGKIKTVIQIVAISAVLLNLPLSWYLMVLAVIITVYSGIEYLWIGRNFFKELA
jgi:CDP-diacylglycerol--glycerol-3-phosphate 3-phosphatidyltransferase